MHPKRYCLYLLLLLLFPAGNNKKMLATCDEAVQLFKTDNDHYYSPYRKLLKSRYEHTASFVAAVSHCPDIAAWNKKF